MFVPPQKKHMWGMFETKKTGGLFSRLDRRRGAGGGVDGGLGEDLDAGGEGNDGLALADDELRSCRWAVFFFFDFLNQGDFA